jgi:flagellar export protein FliJ
MPPVFTLQSVLDVRHSKVEALEVVLGQLLIEEKRARTHHDQLVVQHTQLIKQIQLSMQDEMDLVLLDFLRHSLYGVEKGIVQVNTLLKEFTRLIAARREELIRAHQDEEVLQTLKKQRQEAYQVEQSRIEANLLDDLYTARSFQQRHLGMTGG